MEDLEGDYIAVDQDTFQNGRYDVCVVNGKIRSLSENSIRKLTQVDAASETTVTVDPTDISIIVEADQPHILLDYTAAN